MAYPVLYVKIDLSAHHNSHCVYVKEMGELMKI